MIKLPLHCLWFRDDWYKAHKLDEKGAKNDEFLSCFMNYVDKENREDLQKVVDQIQNL